MYVLIGIASEGLSIAMEQTHGEIYHVQNLVGLVNKGLFLHFDVEV